MIQTQLQNCKMNEKKKQLSIRSLNIPEIARVMFNRECSIYLHFLNVQVLQQKAVITGVLNYDQ